MRSALPSGRRALALVSLLLLAATAFAGTPPAILYQQLRGLTTTGETLHVAGASFKRDRLQFQLTGDFTLAAPVDGKVHALLFRGQGNLQTTGWSNFERGSIKRFLEADSVNVDFTKAIFFFSDDTFDKIKGLATTGENGTSGTPLTAAVEEHVARETGMNIAAWLALAISSPDHPGFFFAEFEGGPKGRFGALVDHQGWVPANIFGLNAGEKGLLYQNRGVLGGNDVWTAFYDESDFQRGSAKYSDAFDLVQVPDYRMTIDLREPGGVVRNDAELDLVALRDNVELIPFSLNEALDEYDNERLKKGFKLRGATLADGTKLDFIQNPWDSAIWVVLPKPLLTGDKITIKLQMAADHTMWDWERSFHYLLSPETWYPRHGYLQRSHFDLTFLHRPKTRVISEGDRVRENVEQEGGKYLLTEWRTPFASALSVFAEGPFELHSAQTKGTTKPITVEYFSVPASFAAVPESFVTQELTNHITFYSQLFGDFPYDREGAAFFPANFGQGFPTMLMLPYDETFYKTARTQFLAHESAHQWWGNKVAWRSYRDLWLSEGFAEYSALLYTARREGAGSATDLKKRWKDELEMPPRTDTGSGRGRVADLGPIIMGSRLASRRSRNAYYTLTYAKGALVLRMLHFLLSNPGDGKDDEFYAMMRDFITQHEGKWATTETFFKVAGEHFARTPIARKYGLHDLNWFMQEWVFDTPIPKYRLEYHYEKAPQGVVLVGTIYQEGVPENWFMPVPIQFSFGNKQVARGTIAAQGAASPVKIPLPAQPEKVEIDPDQWLLSWHTEAHGTK